MAVALRGGDASAARSGVADRTAQTVRDVAGGFGDAPLLIPLAVGLITINHLNATMVFAGAGLLYIATAIQHRLPIPVQPLKAVSAIAISAGLGPSGIAAAGLMIGALFVLLSVTGLADRLRPLFSFAVVRGIQLAVGILLIRTALDQMTRKHEFTFSVGGGVEGLLIGGAVLVLVAAAAHRRLPGVPLLLLGGGVVVGVLVGHHALAPLSFGPRPVSVPHLDGADFTAALWTLAVPQLALSLGNSLMATPATAASYFGQRAERVTPGRLAFSMGVANLAVSGLGGMPMCHGAGGLTAHVRMGARSGVATAVYGAVLLCLGLGAGAAAPELLAVLPVSILAGLLLYVGLMHAALARDLRTHSDLVVALTVAVVSTIAGNITVGVVVALLLTAVLATRRRAVTALRRSAPW
jgi:MFS superfamily sulfate permease-like transporter